MALILMVSVVFNTILNLVAEAISIRYVARVMAVLFSPVIISLLVSISLPASLIKLLALIVRVLAILLLS